MTSSSRTPAPARPDIVYTHSFIDVAVKEPSAVMSAVHEVLHLHDAATRQSVEIGALYARLDALTFNKYPVPEYTVEHGIDVPTSQVRIYRRLPTENESDFTDWKVPTSRIIALGTVSVDAGDILDLIDERTSKWREFHAHAEAYGAQITLALRAAATPVVPDTIEEFKAQCISGAVGWKFEVAPSRTAHLETRTYAR